jgi:hypothetical protein
MSRLVPASSYVAFMADVDARHILGGRASRTAHLNQTAPGKRGAVQPVQVPDTRAASTLASPHPDPVILSDLRHLPQ